MKVLGLLLCCALVASFSPCHAQKTTAKRLYAFDLMEPCTKPFVDWGSTRRELYDALEKVGVARDRIIAKREGNDYVHVTFTFGRDTFHYSFSPGDELWGVYVLFDNPTKGSTKAYVQQLNQLAKSKADSTEDDLDTGMHYFKQCGRWKLDVTAFVEKSKRACIMVYADSNY